MTGQVRTLWRSLDLSIDAYSHTTKALALFVDEEWPELGALNLHARVHTVAGKHRMDDYWLRTVKNASVQVTMTGVAADLTIFPALYYDGIEIDVVAQGADTAALNNIFGLGENVIPAIGAFKAESRVTGNDDTLHVRNVRAQAGSKDVLLVTANGDLGTVDKDGWDFYDAGLKLTANSSSSQSLARA